MSKKNIFLFLTLVILGSIYVYYFTEFFNKPTITISARPRLERGPKDAPPRYSVSFNFDSKCKLTQVKVVSVSELATNKYAPAYWHMISDTNSVPVKGLVYGDNIKGMKPKIPKMKPVPLQPGQTYRLIIEAGKRTGQKDFEVPANTHRASL